MTNPIIGTLADEIAQTRGVIQSAIQLILGIRDRIDQAVQQAIANGATEEELRPFIDLEAALEADRSALASAVQANTPS